MNLTIDKQYKYITYIDSQDNILEGPNQIIYSHEVNHDLLAMMFAKNVGDKTIIPQQMIYANLTVDEISVLSRMGSMQFDMTNELESRYDYKSLLDTMMLTVIDINEDVYYLYLQDDLDSEGLLIDLTSMTDARKLFMIVQSPNTVDNLSAEIHNSMMDPHFNTSGLILFSSDMNNFLNQEVIQDGVNIQSNTILGSNIENYGLSNDTVYLKGIWDKIGNRYLYVVNEESKVV